MSITIRRAETRLVTVGEKLEGYGEEVHHAKQVADVFTKLIEHEAQEVFVVIMLNQRHCIMGWHEVSRGTLTSSLVHPREVFAPALRLGAAAVIVAHNHPSGDPEPSTEDEQVTQRLANAGKLLGIPMLDHVVVGDGKWVSMRDKMEF